MPKKSKKKDKNKRKPKNRASSNPEGGSDVSTSQPYDVHYCENPVKSDADPNKYRVIKLSNGLVALLISCPTDPSIETEYPVMDKLAKFCAPVSSKRLKGSLVLSEEELICPAVCCLCVNAGSFSDPRQVPGVSRVLGTAILDPTFLNDPKISSECKKTLKQPGAYQLVPLSETTIFYIEAPNRVYREAIERLGHALERVVIPKCQTEAARQVVVSFENVRRASLTPENEEAHIFSQCVSRRHPAKTFDEHYLESLSEIDNDKVYREVQKFRKRHYSAHRMTVVMKAELPLDTLETYAKECFSRITNNRLPPQLFDAYNFANSVENTKFRRIWRIDSADCNEIYVKWIIPPSSWLYKTKSLEFLSWLFSRGGAGSLMSYLKMKKWATDVDGRVLNEPAWNTSLYSTFCISATLTAIGNSENKLDVLDAIYSYVNFLKREGPPRSIYDEIRIIRNAQFRYRQDALCDFTDFAKLAEDMHLYPSTDYLAAPFFWYEYDPVSLSTCLDLMTPTKACIVVTDENFGEHLDIKVARPGRGERSTNIPEDWIDRWQTVEPLPDFELSNRNIFCPDDLRMVDAPAVLGKYPIKVHSDSMFEVWYKFDPGFRDPKCHMNVCYMSPLPSESPEIAAMLNLFASVLEDLNHDQMCRARLAGLSYTIYSSFLGLGIGVSGYTHALPLFPAQSIRKSYQSLTKGLFETKKEKLLGVYSKDFCCDRTLAREIRYAILLPGQWISAEKHAALSCLEFERFQDFVKHYLDHVYIKCLVQGNIAPANAVKNALRVVEVSQCGTLSPDMIPRVQINKIPRGKHCCTVKAFGLDSSDVTVENYYQFDDSSVELGGILRFLRASSTDGVVPNFRTSNFAMIDSYRAAVPKSGVNNYALGLVDSGTSTINAERIASIDAEIEEKQLIALAILSASTEVDRCRDMWDHDMDDLITAKREALNFLPSDFEVNWEDIENGEYAFGKPSRQVDALHKMDLIDRRKWITYIADDSNIRKLSIRIVGDKYSRADFSTVKTQPDKSKTGSNNIPLYRLQYLTEHAGHSGNTSYSCITDIHEFKKQLEVSSNTNVTS